MKKKVSERSKKSQEEYADYLMKISVALLTAFLVAILIVPIGAILKSAFESDPSNTSLLSIFFHQ